MSSILIEAQYLPSVDYFCEIFHAEKVVIEAQESFQKQTYRSRTKIITANKVMDLSLPVVKGRKHIPIQEVEIDYSQDWQKQHIRAITSAYGKAPFFEHYWDYILMELEKRHHYLFELNHALTVTILKLLGIQKETLLTDYYQKEVSENMTDLRSVYSPKNKNAPTWHYSYYQLFGNKFVQGMSIIDLLFNVGPESTHIIQCADRTKKI